MEGVRRPAPAAGAGVDGEARRRWGVGAPPLSKPPPPHGALRGRAPAPRQPRAELLGRRRRQPPPEHVLSPRRAAGRRAHPRPASPPARGDTARARLRAAPERCLTWQPGRAQPARPSASPRGGTTRGRAPPGARLRCTAGCAADRPRARQAAAPAPALGGLAARRALSFSGGGRRRAGQGGRAGRRRRRRHGGCAAPGAPPHCSVSRNPSRERQPITPGPPPSLAGGRGDGHCHPIAWRTAWVEPPCRPRPSRGRAVPVRPVGRGRAAAGRGGGEGG